MKNHLKAFRKQHKLTQQEFARQLNVSRQTINSIETGKYDPSLILAFKISRFMSVTIEDVFEPDFEV